MSFEKLLGDLEALQTLQKSQPVEQAEDKKDDAGIAAAAADGEAAGDKGDADTSADADADGDSELGKSFSFQLENGETVEAVDGTELVKSLMARFTAFEGDTSKKEETLTKALGTAVDLIKSQGEAIASLQKEVSRIGGEGRGRKTVVSVSEKPVPEVLQKSQQPEGMTGEAFMNKAMEAQADGRITGHDVAVAEGSLIKGLAVPADIVKRVLA